MRISSMMEAAARGVSRPDVYASPGVEEGALREEAYLKRPPRYPGPYTEQRLREILVDCQMRLAGAIQFAHGLVHDGTWEKGDHASFESEIEDAVKTVQDVYRGLGESAEHLAEVLINTDVKAVFDKLAMRSREYLLKDVKGVETVTVRFGNAVDRHGSTRTASFDITMSDGRFAIPDPVLSVGWYWDSYRVDVEHPDLKMRFEADGLDFPRVVDVLKKTPVAKLWGWVEGGKGLTFEK